MREALFQEYVRLLGERGCDEVVATWTGRDGLTPGGIRSDRSLDD